MGEFEKMNKHQKKEIEVIQRFINEELTEVTKIRNQDMRLSRADVLKNIFMITQNYDELEPVLRDFFEKKHRREKWGGRDEI